LGANFRFTWPKVASLLLSTEEGRAAIKSPHETFGYFLSISQQALSADITKKSAVGIIMKYLNIEY
jgi:hypothetical protein